MTVRTDRRDFAGVVLAAVAVLYSALRTNFVWRWSVVAPFVLSLLLRFVRTHERIADALEPRPDGEARKG